MTTQTCDAGSIVADWFTPFTREQVAKRNHCSTRHVTRVWQLAKDRGLLPDRERNPAGDARLDEPLSPLDPAQIDPVGARGMWRQVIVRAFLDAFGAAPIKRAKARDWFLRADPKGDFEWVCDMAGFEPSFIRAGFAARLAIAQSRATT